MYYGLIPAIVSMERKNNKNKSTVNGKRLIDYTLEAVMDSSLSKTFISTDYPESDFQNFLPSPKFVYLERPLNLRSTGLDSKATDYMEHCIISQGISFNDAIILLQPECIFRKGKDIDMALEAYEYSGKNTLVSGNYLITLKQLYNLDGTLMQPGEHVRADKSTKIFKRNSSIYIFNVGWFIYHKTIFEDNPCFFEMESYKSLEVRNHNDFVQAEAMVKGGILQEW